MTKSQRKILVVGSMNVDMVVKCDRIPKTGETLLGGEFSQFMGGKGANQAVSAANIFPNTDFCAGVGGDVLGSEYLKYLKTRNLGVKLVEKFDGAHTGVALITLDKDGKNIITVAPGANMKLSPKNMRAIDFKQYSHAAFQLENDINTVAEGLKAAKRAGVVTFLTPAPAKLLSAEILKNVDFIIPNEHEIFQIGARRTKSVKAAAQNLLSMGVKNVIVTLGADGCALFNSEGEKHFSAFDTKVADTVGAGDCFTGSLMAALRVCGNLEKAVVFATAAASLKVSKKGAQNLPTLAQIKKLAAKAPKIK